MPPFAFNSSIAISAPRKVLSPVSLDNEPIKPTLIILQFQAKKIMNFEADRLLQSTASRKRHSKCINREVNILVG
jgi:hypothetical protein